MYKTYLKQMDREYIIGIVTPIIIYKQTRKKYIVVLRWQTNGIFFYFMVLLKINYIIHKRIILHEIYMYIISCMNVFYGNRRQIKTSFQTK